jgi:LIM domain
LSQSKTALQPHTSNRPRSDSSSTLNRMRELSHSRSLLSSNNQLGPDRTKEVKSKPLYECASCHTLIKSGGSMFAGKAYHAEHFLCSEKSCGKSLVGLLCFEKNNKIFCEKDYHRLFSPQCAYCKEPIKESAIEALGMHFHSDHFFCSQCGKTFDQNDMFLQVYCVIIIA